MTQAPCYLKTLNELPGVRADYIGRIPGVPTNGDRESVVRNLTPAHQSAVRNLGFSWSQLHRAQQVHGADVSIVRKEDTARVWPEVDGLITAEPGVLLGIYTADCGAVYICDPVCGVYALLHSGKKGTEANITGKAINIMRQKFNSDPSNMIVVLAPCIRPPAYEVDFAAEIKRQVLDSGVPEKQFTDSGICTSKDLENYYSYRSEAGRTGRMLALLGCLDV